MSLDDTRVSDPASRPAEATNSTTLPPEAVPLQPDRSTAELASAVTQDLGELVGMHITLAKTELKEEIRQTARTARLFGIGAFAAYMTVIVLSFALAALLAQWMPTWAGLAIVTGVWALVAGVALFAGKAQLQEIEPVPPQTVETVKGDVVWAQQQRS